MFHRITCPTEHQGSQRKRNQVERGTYLRTHLLQCIHASDNSFLVVLTESTDADRTLNQQTYVHFPTSLISASKVHTFID